jgi:hypothetical protein
MQIYVQTFSAEGVMVSCFTVIVVDLPTQEKAYNIFHVSNLEMMDIPEFSLK